MIRQSFGRKLFFWVGRKVALSQNKWERPSEPTHEALAFLEPSSTDVNSKASTDVYSKL